MSHHLRLLAMAKDTLQAAASTPGRPSQATLRRGVSTAYYALFHFIGEAAARQMVGSDPSAEMVARRHVLKRALAHDHMASFARSVAGGTLSRLFDRPGLPPCFVPSAALRGFARTFVKAKEGRQRADYDLNRPFDLREARQIVDDIEDALATWPTIALADRAMFLMCAVLWPQLKDR